MKKIMFTTMLMVSSLILAPALRADEAKEDARIDQKDLTVEVRPLGEKGGVKRRHVIPPPDRGQGTGNAYNKLLELGYTPEEARNLIDHYENKQDLKEFVRGQRKEHHKKRFDEWLKNHPRAAEKIKNYSDEKGITPGEAAMAIPPRP